MESVDLFATKGIEYLFILVFLAILVFFWKAINPETKPHLALATNNAMNVNWFPVENNRLYHQGHMWVQPTGNDEAIVGLDVLACKLLGPDKKIEIVSPKNLVQGSELLRIKVAGLSVPVLSPIDGKIIDENVEDGCPAPKKPVNMEWLFRIKSENLKANLKNLLNGKLAERWREETEAILNNKISPELGLVLQDGGEIEEGFILSLPEESREEIIKQVFLA